MMSLTPSTVTVGLPYIVFFPDMSFSLNQKFPSGQVFKIYLEMWRFFTFFEAVAYLNGTRG
jgi:hypothetical protein